MWDPVPWFLGGGAEHSPEVFRHLAYAMTGGDEGIVSSGDLKVLPLATPGAGVRVSPGGAIILNRAAGASQQAYAARNPTDDTVTIASTGSGSGRSDLIVAQIEDPWLSGEPWADPVNPKVGPYIFTRVLSNVPASTTRPQDIAQYAGRSAIPLARVDIPANTTVITAGMIKDLRRFGIVKTHRVPITGQPFAAQGPLATWDKWPSFESTVQIPLWATHAVIIATAVGIKVNAATAQGSMRVLLGTLPGPHRQYDLQGVQGQIVDLDAFATLDVTALRGTTQPIKMQTIAGAAGNLITGPASQQLFDIQFERRVS